MNKYAIFGVALSFILIGTVLATEYAHDIKYDITLPGSAASNKPEITISNPWVQKSSTYQGALHFHSTDSDGTASPYEMSKAYADQGFKFAVLTDHNKITSYTAAAGILAIPGEEVTTGAGHILGLNLKAPVAPTNTLQTVVDNIIAQGGLADLAHPTSPIGPIDSAQLPQLTGYTLVEVTNIDAATAITFYDQLLSSGKQVWLAGGDDAHSVSMVNTGGSVEVNADALTVSDITANLKAGNFYVTNGGALAKISSITTSDDAITIKVPDTSTIQWIKQGGEVVKTTKDVLEDSYTVIGDEGYIRVMTTLSSNAAKHAWSQPMSINSAVGPLPVQTLSISNVSLVPGHQQYLEWDVQNTGVNNAWVAPTTGLYAATNTSLGYAKIGALGISYAFDVTMSTFVRVYAYNGLGWFEAQAEHSYRLFSGPVVPVNAKWAVYNADLFYGDAFQGQLYKNELHYNTLR